MKLWKYNEITGYWVIVRNVIPEHAERWLEIFKEDDPNGKYCISKKRPI